MRYSVSDEYSQYSTKWMNNEYEYKYEYFVLYLWKMNKYFLFGLNEYICKYDYKYFLFRICFHSALLLGLKLFVSFSLVLIEYLSFFLMILIRLAIVIA